MHPINELCEAMGADYDFVGNDQLISDAAERIEELKAEIKSLENAVSSQDRELSLRRVPHVDTQQ